MTVLGAISQQWDKATVADLLCQRLAREPSLAQLFSGATSTLTVCHLIAALGIAEMVPVAVDEWQEAQFTQLIFNAFRLLFVKATQQPLTQAEALVMSVASRFSQVIAASALPAAQQQQLLLMQQLSQQLVTLRNQQRNRQRNMC